QVCGHATLRLANAETLPFEFVNFADTIGEYVEEVTKLADSMREETRSFNQMLADGTLAATQDPKEKLALPKAKSEVPKMDFTPLQNALKRLQQSAKTHETAIRNKSIAPAAQKQFDAILIQTERALTSDKGLPRRNWFRHQIYAPGFYTGYGVKTLPGVREAIEQRNWREATEQIQSISATLDNFASKIDSATRLAQEQK
ncbi:MAG TPA: transferrin receptor-like dimerization domain-containing protein, partial [Pyrinomonadaceae bacterium]|nr:transferrin receptor-like dimerization domain-containing protein [Pyrinomonadaceae bacterium]